MESWIGLLGVIIGAVATGATTALWHRHVDRTNLFRRVLAFYHSRIESFNEVVGNLVQEPPKPALEIARAPLRAELLLVAPQLILDAEQELYEFMHHRESEREIKIYMLHRTGNPSPRLVGKGYNESSAITMERLKHAKTLFNEAYERLVYLLRKQMSFWKTFLHVLSEKEPVKLPTEFAVLSSIGKIDQKVYNNPDSVEAIWRGRNADRMAARGASPFDVNAYNEMKEMLGSGAVDLGIRFDPPTPGTTIENDQSVPGCLGYDYAYIYSPERLVETKKKISEYFKRVPGGVITFKRRIEKDSREWCDKLSGSKEDWSHIEEFLDQEYKAYLDSQERIEEIEQTKWAELLRKVGKKIPESPVQ